MTEELPAPPKAALRRTHACEVTSIPGGGGFAFRRGARATLSRPAIMAATATMTNSGSARKRLLKEEDMTKVEFETSEEVDVTPTFDTMGLREDLLRGIYAYGRWAQARGAGGERDRDGGCGGLRAAWGEGGAAPGPRGAEPRAGPPRGDLLPQRAVPTPRPQVRCVLSVEPRAGPSGPSEPFIPPVTASHWGLAVNQTPSCP